jgi:triacylglycerol lipase
MKTVTTLKSVRTALRIALPLAVSALFALTGCSANASNEDESASSEEALAAAPALGNDPHGEPTRYPIVLAHGFLGSRTGFASFHELVTDGLEADGHRVYRAEVPPFGSVRDRARALARDVDKVLLETGAKKVNIVAHSMGGLDARDLVSSLGYGDRVASVTTIGTPHRGSRIADVALKLVDGASNEALDAFAKAIGKTYSEVADDADVKGALADLAEKNADAFNAARPNDPRVHYQSWAGVSSLFAIPNPADAAACDHKLLSHPRRADVMGPVLAGGAPIVSHGGKSNDGFVLVSSAKWGEFRGCVPADHADEIGVFRTSSLDRHSGFDFVRFHRNIAFDLAARGF